MKRYALTLLLILCVAACTSDSKPAEKAKFVPMKGEFKSKTIQLNEHEHVTVFDMPNYYLGSRCWVFVNEKTNTSHMKCDDSFGNEMPE
ncbi:hypothetical protein ACO0K3_03835 [Undibacterium sp. Rencai35W]|uniref:hypothetical protein n=1 Tax=Undibacterium sp. Rencai35W TaxID=3413046 RepID=UPI003BEF64E6